MNLEFSSNLKRAEKQWKNRREDAPTTKEGR
jgi:hypothetical protein